MAGSQFTQPRAALRGLHLAGGRTAAAPSLFVPLSLSWLLPMLSFPFSQLALSLIHFLALLLFLSFFHQPQFPPPFHPSLEADFLLSHPFFFLRAQNHTWQSSPPTALPPPRPSLHPLLQQSLSLPLSSSSLLLLPSCFSFLSLILPRLLSLSLSPLHLLETLQVL